MRWRILAIAVISIAVFGAPAAHASVIQNPPNNIGLVGYWSFNEGTSTIAHDYSGHGNTGTLSGSTLPTWTSGKLGKGLSFDGSSSYVSAPLVTTANENVTLSAWVYWKGLTSHVQMVVNNGNSGSGGYSLMISNGCGAGSSIAVLLGGVQCNALSSPPTIPTNRWTHLVATMDGSHNWTLYVNGVSEATGNDSPNTPAGATDIGANETGVGNFNGLIDEVRIYSRALSAAQVAALYQSGAAKINSSQSPGTLASGLVGWWTMDGADTNWTSPTTGVEYDKSGNGNTGTLTSMNRATSPVIGKIGQAMTFDGSTQYIPAPSFTLNPSAFTISAWYKLRSTAAAGVMVGQDTAGVSENDWALYYRSSTNQLTFLVEQVAFVVSAPAGVGIDTTSFHHVTVTRDASNNYVMYIDGTAVGTGNNAAVLRTLATFAIGGLGDGTGVDFNGVVDDVRAYNRALSASEVKQLYTLGAGTHVNTSSANLQNGSTLNTGLVGYWTFDGSDLSGSTVYDLSGNGNNGTNNGATPTIGKLGQALKFDGSTSYVDAGNTSPLSLTSAATISAWIKVVNGTSYQVVAGKMNFGGDNNGYVISVHNNALHIEVADGSSYSYIEGCGTIINNTWTHATFSFDGALLRGYINGGKTCEAVQTVTPVSNVWNFVIGRDPSGIFAFFNGSIDDVRVYSRALSASEIQKLYLMGK
jgi:hypothetical protein